MNVGATIHDGRNASSAKFGAHIKRNILLPPAPCVGMTVVTEIDFWKVKEARWNANQPGFFLVFEEKFKEMDVEGIGYATFEEWLSALSGRGWAVSSPFAVN
jgi:hypothetical protein